MNTTVAASKLLALLLASEEGQMPPGTPNSLRRVLSWLELPLRYTLRRRRIEAIHRTRKRQLEITTIII